MQQQNCCAGVDEAGCGSLIGDLVACAVVIPDHVRLDGNADSKKLSAKKRTQLAATIRDTCAVGVGVVSCTEIDTYSFAWARRAVFQRALDALAGTDYTRIIVDGTGFFDGYGNTPFLLEAKADAKYDCVAAASVVAKVHRDKLVVTMCDEDSAAAALYGWRTNMGYPTRAHLAALQRYGSTRHHRMSFAPCRQATPSTTLNPRLPLVPHFAA
tara:strand:+ start:955 stop:1593 length:639 start_codon:yes stop_codon:yes gene_type:complete